MPAGPALLKGCLPVWIVVNAGRDADTPNGPGEYWEEIEEIRWLKRDGSPGSVISQKLRDEAEAQDYGFCDMLERFWDDRRYEQDEAERKAAGCVCDDISAFVCTKECKYRPVTLALHDITDARPIAHTLSAREDQ